jgi:hypothetical protein
VLGFLPLLDAFQIQQIARGANIRFHRFLFVHLISVRKYVVGSDFVCPFAAQTLDKSNDYDQRTIAASEAFRGSFLDNKYTTTVRPNHSLKTNWMGGHIDSWRIVLEPKKCKQGSGWGKSVHSKNTKCTISCCR